MEFITTGWLLEHATYSVIFGMLVVAGLGLPFPEDIVLLTAGAMIHRGATTLAGTSISCVAGIILGDLLLFMMARRLGSRALEHALFRKLLPPTLREKLERLFEKWGGIIVFVARNIAGIRAPAFALAGMHGMRPLTFMLWDMLGMCISVPVMIGLGYLFSNSLDSALNDITRVEHLLAFSALLALVVFLLQGIIRRAISRQKR